MNVTALVIVSLFGLFAVVLLKDLLGYSGRAFARWNAAATSMLYCFARARGDIMIATGEATTCVYRPEDLDLYRQILEAGVVKPIVACGPVLMVDQNRRSLLAELARDGLIELRVADSRLTNHYRFCGTRTGSDRVELYGETPHDPLESGWARRRFRTKEPVDLDANTLVARQTKEFLDDLNRDLSPDRCRTTADAYRDFICMTNGELALLCRRVIEHGIRVDTLSRSDIERVLTLPAPGIVSRNINRARYVAQRLPVLFRTLLVRSIFRLLGRERARDQVYRTFWKRLRQLNDRWPRAAGLISRYLMGVDPRLAWSGLLIDERSADPSETITSDFLLRMATGDCER